MARLTSLSLPSMCGFLHFGNTGGKIAVSPSYHTLFNSNIAKRMHRVSYKYLHQTFSSNHIVKFAFVSRAGLCANPSPKQ